MIYAQIKAGRKLHLACEPGEEYRNEIIRAGYLSHPICGQPMTGNYRMTINVPLAHGCRKCRAAFARLVAITPSGRAALSKGTEGE